MLSLWKIQQIKFKWFVQGYSSNDRVKTRLQCTKWQSGNILSLSDVTDTLAKQDFADKTGNSAHCYVAAMDWRGVWGRIDTRICKAESLCCVPETITTLLIGYLLVAQLCPTLLPHELQPSRILCPLNSPGNNTGVGSCSFLQGIFSTQGFTI